LKLEYDKLVSKLAINFNLRRYSLVEAMPRAKPQLEGAQKNRDYWMNYMAGGVLRTSIRPAWSLLILLLLLLLHFLRACV